MKNTETLHLVPKVLVYEMNTGRTSAHNVPAAQMKH